MLLAASVGSSVQLPVTRVRAVCSMLVNSNPSGDAQYISTSNTVAFYGALYGLTTNSSGSIVLQDSGYGSIASLLYDIKFWSHNAVDNIASVYDRLETVRSSLAGAIQTVQLNQATIGGKIDAARSSVDSLSSSLYWAGSLTGSDAMGYAPGRLFAMTVNHLYSLRGAFSDLFSVSSSPFAWSGQLLGSDATGFSPGSMFARISNFLYSVRASSQSAVDALGVLDSLDSSFSWRGSLDGSSSKGFLPGHLLALMVNHLYSARGSLALLNSTDSVFSWRGDLLGTAGGSFSPGQLLAILNNRLFRVEGYLSDGLSVDVDFPSLDAVIAKLDGIIDLMRLGLAVDVADAILGDLDFSALSALTADVSGALSSAFPFCVPAVLHQVLGLVQADAVPPVVDFDFWGSPLHLDFSDWRGIGDVTGWVCRVAFAVVLLVNTRRFVFAGGSGIGGGSS